MFRSLGLSTTAEAVYRAMLAEPTWGVAELARSVEVSTRQVHDALDELIELALVRESGDIPGRLRPTNPEVGLAPLLARARASIARQQYEIEATQAAVEALAEAHSDNRHRDRLVRLPTLDAVRDRLEHLAALAGSECLSFIPGGPRKFDAIAVSRPFHRRALEHGIAVRAVYQDSFRNDPETLAYARWFSEMGGEARTVPLIHFQLTVVDRRLALLPIDPADPRKGAVEIHSPGVTTAVCALFDQVWSSATPFGSAAPVDDNGLEPPERELLRLLGDGHTDESAARRLGLSVRTIQRMMSDLTDRLGAASRFQAGANAVRQRWL
ncbi:LuxR family transcriptional regulator [Polymorphospora lycopeni]|uniref:Helix-turn-helix transcriptional regulator n=1 Tax=Polymorphospora lycopeni TaxID=3140240 RepID=A0ABV5CJR8_9ACTN